LTNCSHPEKIEVKGKEIKRYASETSYILNYVELDRRIPLLKIFDPPTSIEGIDSSLWESVNSGDTLIWKEEIKLDTFVVTNTYIREITVGEYQNSSHDKREKLKKISSDCRLRTDSLVPAPDFIIQK
jgi:hypothetical protein